jgi:hypothetical protein
MVLGNRPDERTVLEIAGRSAPEIQRSTSSLVTAKKYVAAEDTAR